MTALWMQAVQNSTAAAQAKPQLVNLIMETVLAVIVTNFVEKVEIVAAITKTTA